VAGKAIVEAYTETGFNYRMTDIQAAMGLVQLRRLVGIVARRRELAAGYHELLDDAPELTPVRDPAHGATNYQSYWVLLGDEIRATQRDVLAHLAARGISARRGIMAAHLEPAYAGHPHRALPVTERLTTRSLILPLHHELTADEQLRVAGALRGVLESA
jgi:perosamine synthetase